MEESGCRARQASSWKELPHEAKRIASVLLALVLLTWMTGCATNLAESRHPAFQNFDLSEDGRGSSLCKEEDDFQLLQRSAGLEEDSWHEAGEELEKGDAQALWGVLGRTQTTLRGFGPRRSLFFLLRQVLSRGQDAPYAELLQRSLLFHFLVVMRPDGYLVSALTGHPLQRMGSVQLRQGKLMAGAFEVGAFYWNKGGVFYPVDEALRPSGGLVGELGLERDVLNAALDGAEDALGETVRALAHLITRPVRSLEGLQQLPAAVAALIASSPEYFARYSARPLQEQIREAARLSTHLLLLYGGAAGTATRVGTAGAKLPVLSLSAEGTLALEQVALPAGTLAAALGTGAGGVYVLMEPFKNPAEKQSSGAATEAGPGFKPFTEGNFRENLARLTGQKPAGAHAHHVFPQKFIKEFQEAGINIHDPRFGAWWERTSHLKNTGRYNSKWEALFQETNPTMEQILQFGRELGGEFGFQVHF